MGKLGRAIAAGVAGGLTELGAGMRRKEEQERVDERLAKEDQFKERQLSIQEKDASLRADAAETQKFFDNVKMNHLKLTKQLAGSAGNLNVDAAAFTKYFKDNRIYKNNPARAEEEGAFAVMDISFLDQDPITGEVKVDPTTGLPTEIRASRPAGRERIFKTEGDYQAFRTLTSNPEIATAMALQKLTAKEALAQQEKMLDMLEGTAKVKREAAATEAKTKADEELAKLRGRTDPNLRAGTSAKDKTGFVTSITGKDIPITSATQQRLTNDNKAMQKKFDGVTTGETYRIGEVIKNATLHRALGITAQMVLDGDNVDGKKLTRERAIQGIMVKYKLSKGTAGMVFDEYSDGLEESRSAWRKAFDWLQSGAGDVDDIDDDLD